MARETLTQIFRQDRQAAVLVTAVAHQQVRKPIQTVVLTTLQQSRLQIPQEIAPHQRQIPHLISQLLILPLPIPPQVARLLVAIKPCQAKAQQVRQGITQIHRRPLQTQQAQLLPAI